MCAGTEKEERKLKSLKKELIPASAEERGISRGERLEQLFYEKREINEKVLIIYLCAGYPDLDFSRELILTAVKAGADIIEVGIPFSDPLADGPAIQHASQQALLKGMNAAKALEMAADIKKCTKIPLLLMSYYNPIYRYGLEKFCGDAFKAEVDGIIVPDLPVEESEKLVSITRNFGLGFVPLVSPTSTLERLKRISKTALGFIYCVSTTGTTGSTIRSFGDAKEMAEKLRSITQKPTALGFGIEGPEHVRMAAPMFDGIIVGSAVIRIIEHFKKSRESCFKEVGEFISSLKKACR
ncbi:MAG TPA: tryptophan synthase subunit alpha [Peptococcaceae bacterium]|nr:tryptophan synthase subunit alpha [Peptococcaceae bacterium]